MSQQSNQLRSNLEIDSIQKIQSQENHSQLEINTKDQNQIGQEQFKNLQEIESSMNQQIYKNNEFKNYLSSLCDEIYQLIQQFWIIICEQYLQYFNIQQAELSNEELTFPNLKFENKLDEIQDNMKTISDKYIKELKKLIELAQSNKEQIFDIIYSQSLQSCKSLKVDYQNQRNENNERDHQKDGQQQQQTNNNEVEQNIFSNQNSYFINQIQEEINQVNQLIEKAELLQKEGKFKESINYYDNVLKINEKKNIICWRGKGDCLRKLKCFTDAIQCYDKALNIQKNDISSLIGKGECLTMLEKYQESKLVYQEVLKYDDKNLASRFGLGECLRLQGSFKEAIEQYDIALKMDEKNVACIQGKADECFLQILKIDPQNQIAKKEHEQCVKQLNKTQLSKNTQIKINILEENQKIFYTEDLSNRGQQKIPHIKQLKQSNTQQEQQIINFNAYKSQSVMPNPIQIHVLTRSESFDNRNVIETINQADDLKKQGKYQDALKLYEKVLEKDPNHIPSLNGKGNCLRLMLRFQDSITFLDRALALNKNSTSLYGKGESLRMINYFEEANKCYLESLRMCQEESKNQDPLIYMNLRGLGDILRVKADFEKSIQLYDEALQMNEDHVLSLFGKAESLRGLAKYEESIIFYKRSLSLNQNHLMSLSGLGESLRILKYYQEAQKYHEKALEIDNDRIVNLRGLSECLRHQNNSQKALDYIEKALKINSSDEKCLNSRSAILKDLEKQKATLKLNKQQ